MTRDMAPAQAFKAAKAFAWLGLISLVLFFIGIGLAVVQSSDLSATNYVGLFAVLISVVTLIVATVGTASTILLGWRGERRQNEEFKLKIEQLKLDLDEAKAAKASPLGATEPSD